MAFLGLSCSDAHSFHKHVVSQPREKVMSTHMDDRTPWLDLSQDQPQHTDVHRSKSFSAEIHNDHFPLVLLPASSSKNTSANTEVHPQLLYLVPAEG